MISSKQRAELRAMSNGIETIIHIGKSGITDTLTKQADDALTARELIKGKVLENAPITSREACDALAKVCKAEPVQTIGTKFVLYRENKKLATDKRIKLTNK